MSKSAMSLLENKLSQIVHLKSGGITPFEDFMFFEKIDPKKFFFWREFITDDGIKGWILMTKENNDG